MSGTLYWDAVYILHKTFSSMFAYKNLAIWPKLCWKPGGQQIWIFKALTFFRFPEAPLRPEARGICHSCHMDNPALLLRSEDRFGDFGEHWTESKARTCKGVRVSRRIRYEAPPTLLYLATRCTGEGEHRVCFDHHHRCSVMNVVRRMLSVSWINVGFLDSSQST